MNILEKSEPYLTTHPIELLYKEYLNEIDISTGTKELYQTVLKQYTSFLVEKNITYATTIDVKQYIEMKRNQGYSSKWMYHQIGTIKRFYRYLSENQPRLGLPVVYLEDITVAIPSEHATNKEKKRVLSLEDTRKLLYHLKSSRKYIWQYRDYAMFYLMITTGLRSIEIRRARRKDLVTQKEDIILYIQGKGRSSRDEFVKISPLLYTALQDYLKKRKDKNPYLFISHSHKTNVPYLSRYFFYRTFERILSEASLPTTLLTTHRLRHTAASLNLERGGTLEETKSFLRHTELNTTLIYTENEENKKEDLAVKLEHYLLGEERIHYEEFFITFYF